MAPAAAPRRGPRARRGRGRAPVGSVATSWNHQPTIAAGESLTPCTSRTQTNSEDGPHDRTPFPRAPERPSCSADTVYTIASGDLRPRANTTCWPVQQAAGGRLRRAHWTSCGWSVQRAHGVDPATGHGFIDSQRRGLEVFKRIPADAPLIVVDAVWQYSHHVLAGLRTHRGPILIVANWSGEFPGLVGLLNLGAQPDQGRRRLLDAVEHGLHRRVGARRPAQWLDTRLDRPRPVHVRDLPDARRRRRRGRARRGARRRSCCDDKAIIGVFDEGCMGMYNAIIDDELLNPLGIYKERLSQSALVAEMRKVDRRRGAARSQAWLDDAGLRLPLRHRTRPPS